MFKCLPIVKDLSLEFRHQKANEKKKMLKGTEIFTLYG